MAYSLTQERNVHSFWFFFPNPHIANRIISNNTDVQLTKFYFHLFSQNPATNTENSAQSRSEHIFMELTLFVYNINSQYFCIKSGLNYLRYKRYNRNETEGHIFFCNLNFHRNGIYILYINCYHHRKIYVLHWLVVPLYIEHFWTIIYHINTFKSYFHEIFCKSWFIFSIYKANVFV